MTFFVGDLLMIDIGCHSTTCERIWTYAEHTTDEKL